MATYGHATGAPPVSGRGQNTASSPVYQIDFTAVDSGKRIASTKRRIRWRFGFTNQDALTAGETGTSCRGEEHDITLIWSLTSGKRLVLADGQEVHYSNNRNHVFDFSWTMRGNHVLKVVAHASAPSNAAPGFRQYDFFVDGMSFFNMPKVYRLGLSGSAPINEPSESLALATSTRRSGNYSNYSVGGGTGERPSMPPQTESIAAIEAPNNRDEEQAYLAEAIKNSLKEQSIADNNAAPTSSNSVISKPNEENLLIDFMSEPGDIPSKYTAPMSKNQHSAPRGASSFDQQSTHLAPAPLTSFDMTATGAPASAEQNPFSFPPVQTAPVPAPPSSPPQVAQAPNSIFAQPTPSGMPPTTPMTAAPVSVQPTFAPAPVTAPAPAPTFAPAPVTAPAPTFAPAPVPPAPVNEPTPPAEPTPVAPTPTQNGSLPTAKENDGLGFDIDAAFKKFANMDQLDLVSKKDPNSRDNPFDEVLESAPAPTLAGMKAMGPQSEKKEIMKSAEPSALVISGNQQGNWGGYNGLGSQAPTLNQSMGGGGYGQMGNMNQTAPMGQPGYGMAATQQQAMQQPYQYPSSGASVGSQPMMQGQQQYGYQQTQANYGQPQAQQQTYGYMQPQQQR